LHASARLSTVFVPCKHFDSFPTPPSGITPLHTRKPTTLLHNMLQTTIYSAGARGVIRLPMAMRSGLRPHFVYKLSTSTPLNTIAQRSFTSTCSASKATTFFTLPSHSHTFPLRNSTILERLRSSTRFFHNSRARLNGKPTSPNATSNLSSPPKGSSSPNSAIAEPQTLGARMRKLSREYGWSALGVYLVLTALDFPFCYLLVRYLGTDKIGKLTSSILVLS